MLPNPDLAQWTGFELTCQGSVLEAQVLVARLPATDAIGGESSGAEFAHSIVECLQERLTSMIGGDAALAHSELRMRKRRAGIVLSRAFPIQHAGFPEVLLSLRRMQRLAQRLASWSPDVPMHKYPKQHEVEAFNHTAETEQ